MPDEAMEPEKLTVQGNDIKRSDIWSRSLIFDCIFLPIISYPTHSILLSKESKHEAFSPLQPWLCYSVNRNIPSGSGQFQDHGYPW